MSSLRPGNVVTPNPLVKRIDVVGFTGLTTFCALRGDVLLVIEIDPRLGRWPPGTVLAVVCPNGSAGYVAEDQVEAAWRPGS